MNRTALIAAFALVAGSPAFAHPRADLTGAYALHAESGARIGQASINGEGDGLVLRARLNDGRTRTPLALDPARSTSGKLVFARSASNATSDGLIGGLAGSDAAPTPNARPRTVELTRLNDGSLRAVIKEGDAVVGRERLTRVRAALLVHASTYDETHVSAFRGYATRIARLYRARGYVAAETMLGTSIEVVVDRLLKAEADGQPFDRVVFIGHGGWDGPVLGKYSEEGHHQASSHYNPEAFAKLVDAVKRGTTPAARIFSSSCHAGGSNVYERAAGRNEYVWTDDLAVRTGRIVAGPAGYTSTEYTQQHVLAVLEGEGVTVQEVRWASGTGSRTIKPRSSLAATPIGPVPEVHLPEPVTASAPEPTEPAAEPVAAAPAVVDLPLGETAD